MEEKLSFRQLRQNKPNKVKSTSQKLLLNFPHKLSRNSRSIMSKNVSLYQHMITDPHAKENYVDWAINLRDHPKAERNTNGGEAPAAFFKDTQISKFRKNMKEKFKSLNSSEFSQFTSKSRVYTNKDALDFMNSLRESHREGQLTKNSRRFHNIGKKDRKDIPKFLTSKAVKKTRNLDENDYQSGYDGDFKFPPYTYSMLREKNSALLEELAPSSSKVNMGNLMWKVGLRSY